MIDKILADIDANTNRNVARLEELLRVPSVSTDPRRKQEMHRAANWILDLLKSCGLECELVETKGHPCIVGDSGPTSGGGPTVLIYGHYDVQPAIDESLWDSPPFEPAIRNGLMFARGSADDKGQLLLHLIAVEAWMKTAGRLPVRVKFLIEGEEEIGSPNLKGVIEKYKNRLACDYVALSDTAKLDTRTPAITYGAKGLVYKELAISGPKQDLHSGSFGGTVANPGNALALLISRLKDENERVTIPGFYDAVRPLSNDELAKLRSLPFDDEAYLGATGSPALVGEEGFSTLERRWIRPTLDVNGLFGGFSGEGASTIIPKRVGAKVSMRIVPDQDPDTISRLFDQAVEKLAPPGVRVDIITHGLASPYVSPIDSPGMRAAVASIAEGFGTAPVFIREGGSLPILPLFKSVLGADSLMMGFCDPNCNAHGPNEFFALDDFHRGARTAAIFLEKLSQV